MFEPEVALSTCIASIEVGDIQVQVFEESDDYLRFEFRGETVNWCDYPSRIYEAQIHRDELTAMDEEISSVTAYAGFAAEQLHANFCRRWIRKQTGFSRRLESGFPAYKNLLKHWLTCVSRRKQEKPIWKHSYLIIQSDRAAL